ncbi:MAG: hypothetical protein EXQ85_02080 [Alphaproteobacteria bacterium]|nr:hypothetical protein [Alphaproteobacteria bacterium]
MQTFLILALLGLLGAGGLYLVYRPHRRLGARDQLSVGGQDGDDDLVDRTIESRLAELEDQKKRGQLTDDEYRARKAELVGDKRRFRWRRHG